MPKTWKIGPAGPDRAQAEEIIDSLRRGKVLFLPTDTIYGIHGSALDEQAVSRIFELKGRSPEKALPVIFSNVEQLREVGVILSADSAEALARIWPAPLTAILQLRKPIPATAGSLTIAVRVPALAWLRGVMEASGPLASTSANRSGEKPLQNCSELPPDLEAGLGGVVDAGPIRGTPSTIVDFTTDPPTVLRQGEFFFTQNLWKTARKTL